MTYLQFHAVFIVPPLLVLAWLSWGRTGRRASWSLVAVALLALVWTTPWDNYLVWRGVWDYSPGRVMGTIGYVPVEEYLFFVLQPLLTGLFLLRWMDGARVDPSPLPSSVRWTGTAIYGMMAVAGFLLLRSERGTYMGLILAWAMPVLAGQWAYAADALWRRRRALIAVTALSTVYLWIADAVAIKLGIWRIAERFTLGIGIGWLPIEEMTFFLVTNILVVQGLVLFLVPPGVDGRTMEAAR